MTAGQAIGRAEVLTSIRELGPVENDTFQHLGRDVRRQDHGTGRDAEPDPASDEPDEAQESDQQRQ
jgi:hypothetical protein